MRIAVRLFGRELIAIEVAGAEQAEAEINYGVPFGFSGGSGSHLERAESWDVECGRHTRSQHPGG